MSTNTTTMTKEEKLAEVNRLLAEIAAEKPDGLLIVDDYGDTVLEPLKLEWNPSHCGGDYSDWVDSNC